MGETFNDNIGMSAQSPTQDWQSAPPGFPACPGAFAALIRERDWSATSLGPIEGWSERLRTAVNIVLNASLPMTLLWGLEGVLIYNEGYSRIAGPKHPEIFGLPACEAWPEHADFNADVIRRGALGESFSLPEQKFPLVRSGQPETFWLDLHYTPVKDESGATEGILAIVVDVTERIVAEEKRQSAENQIRLAMEGGDIVGTYDWHIQEDLVYTDTRFADLYSVPPEKAIQGAPIADYLAAIHPDDLDRVGAQIQETIDTGKKFSTEYRVVSADGKEQWIIASGNCYYDEGGKPLRFAGVVVNITERKLAEETLARQHALVEEYARRLESSNKDLSQFASVVSHDLQAPLRKLFMFGDILQDREAQNLSEEGKDSIRRIQRSARRMQELITDLLELARIDQSGNAFVTVRTDQLIETLQEDLALEIRESGAEIEIGEMENFEADHHQMLQLLTNLVGNSIKYARPDLPPRIRVHCRKIDPASVEIMVADNGIGIKPQYYQKIFEIFQRLHSEAKYTGTGIGLAIVKRIVDRHRGHIALEPSESGGTVVRITLPAHQNSLDETARLLL